MTQRWTNQSPTRGARYDPFEHAAELGISVIFRPIRTANELWLPEHDTIVIKSGMRAVHDRAACAHGLGHAVLGHTDDRPKHEVMADRWACRLLVDHDELTRLLRWADLPTIGQELGVTQRLLRVYLNISGLAS